jgi:hypothetical protein
MGRLWTGRGGSPEPTGSERAVIRITGAAVRDESSKPPVYTRSMSI